MPMRNAACTIDECLESVVHQTYPHFEVILIDDGSTDESLIKARLWSRHDRRIKLYRQQPQGLVAALNHALALAKGKFIARMDADDIMLPHRLQAQVEYLTRHPRTHLVATQVALFPHHLVSTGYQEYIRWQNQCLTPQDMLDEIYVESPIAHPSVMLRRSVFAELGGYRHGDFPEDYELWLRMINRKMRLAKLPQVLLKWRQSSGRSSRVDSRYDKQKFDALRARFLRKDPRINTQRPLVLWGAGRKTRKRVALLGLKPAAWIDVDRKKIGKTYMDAPVVSHTWLREYSRLDNSIPVAMKPFVLSYVTNHGASRLIADELRASGFERGKDYLMVG